MIYCQNDIPKHQFRYGLRSSAAAGCGWIAVYNILCLFQKPAVPEKIIYEMEHDVPLINGIFGSFLMSPAWVLRKHGFEVKFTTKLSQMDELAEDFEAGILFYWWKSKRTPWKLGAHFVAVEKTEEGYIGYNTYSNSKGPDKLGTSIEGFLNRRTYFGAVYFGVRPVSENLNNSEKL